jgi:Xaa-Pro aminopeptidase
MDERLNHRLRRATAEATAQGYAAMIVSPSPDLAYLTGYEPMPMERPTPPCSAKRTP